MISDYTKNEVTFGKAEPFTKVTSKNLKNYYQFGFCSKDPFISISVAGIGHR